MYLFVSGFLQLMWFRLFREVSLRYLLTVTMNCRRNMSPGATPANERTPPGTEGNEMLRVRLSGEPEAEPDAACERHMEPGAAPFAGAQPDTHRHLRFLH